MDAHNTVLSENGKVYLQHQQHRDRLIAIVISVAIFVIGIPAVWVGATGLTGGTYSAEADADGDGDNDAADARAHNAQTNLILTERRKFHEAEMKVLLATYRQAKRAADCACADKKPDCAQARREVRRTGSTSITVYRARTRKVVERVPGATRNRTRVVYRTEYVPVRTTVDAAARAEARSESISEDGRSRDRRRDRDDDDNGDTPPGQHPPLGDGGADEADPPDSSGGADVGGTEQDPPPGTSGDPGQSGGAPTRDGGGDDTDGGSDSQDEGKPSDGGSEPDQGDGDDGDGGGDDSGGDDSGGDDGGSDDGGGDDGGSDDGGDPDDSGTGR